MLSWPWRFSGTSYFIRLTTPFRCWNLNGADGWAGGLAVFFSPFDAVILSILHPLLSPLAKLFRPCGPAHTGLYEKRDVMEFIKQQKDQHDNRVSESDLLIAFNAMQFGDKQVGQVMTPRRKVKLVSGDELAGPVLADELHKTGFSRFPVVKDSAKAASPKIIGTLYLNQLIGYDGNAKVKDLANKDVFFINEDNSLLQALDAFLKTHHHLLIVVNSFEEVVGVLSLEDVLEQILGRQIVEEFDNYENPRAVASQEAKQQPEEQKETEPEPAEEPAAVN
jgi:metal transporter CNNM